MKKTALLLFASMAFPSFVLAATPYNGLMVNEGNLKNFPQKIHEFDPGVEVTLGDLHGNALKLVYFLISNKVMELSKKDYKKLVRLYTLPTESLTTGDLNEFQEIINNAKYFSDQKIRFLGDDLCDRGMNDYFTLTIFKKLDQVGVPFDVVLSNHGNFFLTTYEKNDFSFTDNPYGEGRHESLVQSMLKMGQLIEKGVVDKNEVVTALDQHYLKHIKLPGYLVDKKNKVITLYSHAPIDLEILSNLAKDLNIPFDDSNLDELVKSLEAINNQISKWIMGHTFSSHYQQLNDDHKKDDTLSPIEQVLWNRDYSILNRKSPEHKNYTINYVHGHDSESNVFNLDNLFGKGDKHFKGPYAVHISHS